MRCAKFIILCWLGSSLWSEAITVASLQKELQTKEKVTLIDLRDPTQFVQGHIPGAINIPASLCPHKRLPPLGNVVVYDDGLSRQGTTALKSATEALARKPGIAVDTLQGGYAAWEEAHGLTTRGKGVRRESFNYVTYQQLQAMTPDDVILVDLRKLTKTVLKFSASLTDLSREFPGRRVTSSAPPTSGGGPLVVLIDSADGTAEASARLLKVGGVRRYAILVGGELAIFRKGRPGLERSGGSHSTVNNSNTPVTGQSRP